MHFKNKTILIISPFRNSEFEHPKFGATRLIAEQIAYFKSHNFHVNTIAKSDLGRLVGAIYGWLNRVRQPNVKRITKRIATQKRWLLSLLSWFFREFLDYFDVWSNCSFDAKGQSLTIIHHSPACLFRIAQFYKKHGAEIIVYQHNIEWKFYEDKLNNKFLNFIFIPLLRRIEIRNLKCADKIVCVSEFDKQILVSEGGFAPSVIDVWVAFPVTETNRRYNYPDEIQEKIANKLVVGFVGTNFAPNIDSVREIIVISKSVATNVVFLIIGNVSEAFEKELSENPNVVFTGFVDDMDSYLSVCDVFINPKNSSDTGIEIKMFDYIKFDKPIICTPGGARGCENMNNLHVLTSSELIIDFIDNEKKRLCK